MWSIFSPQQANKELQDNNDTLFCNPASKQQIRKLKLKYDGKSCTWQASPLKSHVIGANNFNPLSIN